MMAFIYPTNGANFCLRVFIANNATKGITRVGRIGNHASIVQNFDRLMNQSRLWVFCMNGKVLRHLMRL